ncbi:hypothetical protein [Pedobacter nutrimenti]|uniref:hypothetical protein n=1 Tax=Pedobacter nutrimenti TaxID=1241337 RepID=UPI002931DEB5|nr:hypothetical protein [Pedobacter nutrimenti]
MEKISRSIGMGMVLGAALFFVPGIFAFVLAAMVFGIALIAVFRRPKREFFRNKFSDYGHGYQKMVPIDNQWYRPGVAQKGLVRDIDIND